MVRSTTWSPHARARLGRLEGGLPQVREVDRLRTDTPGARCGITGVHRAALAPRQPAGELVAGAQLRRVRRVARFARLEQAQGVRQLLSSPLQTGSSEDRPAGPTRSTSGSSPMTSPPIWNHWILGSTALLHSKRPRTSRLCAEARASAVRPRQASSATLM